MAIFKNPLNRNQYLPYNQNTGDMGLDIIVPNVSTRLIRDLELPSQLNNTNSRHMFRLRTREDAYRDVTIESPVIFSRQRKSRTKYQKHHYHTPRI